MKIPEQNNFDLIRLLLAITVFLVHGSDLSGGQGLVLINRVLNTETAVLAFFSISGFLVSASYANSRSFTDYISKRIRRVFPGYFFVVLFCALAGGLLSSRPEEYFSSALIRYLWSNLLFLNFIEPALPGVFEQNISHALNGALWTIRFELLFYLAVPFLFLLRRKGFSSGPPLMLAAACTASALAGPGVSNRVADSTYVMLLYYVPLLLSAFLSGAVLYFSMDRPLKHAWVYGILALLGYFFTKGYGLAFVSPLFLAVFVLFLGIGLPCLGNAGRYGDMSYGIYIWHYPILQYFISVGLFRVNPSGALALSGCVIVLLAYGSWHIIEKPFLKRSSHYRRAGGMP